MRRFLLILAYIGLASGAAQADGLSPITLQNLLAAGQVNLLSQYRDTSTTTVVAAGTTASRTLAARFADTLNVKDFGAACDGVTNDYAALTRAQAAGQAAGAADIVIPAGCRLNLGGQLIYTVNTNTWRYGPGSAIVSGGVQGLLDTATYNNVTYSKTSSADFNENGVAAYALYNQSPQTAGYQKNGFYTRITSLDPSTYTVGSLTDSILYAKDVVGYESQVQASGSADTTARLYGYHGEVSFPAGSDGNANVAEFEINNAGSYTPQTSKAASKRVLHLDNVGPNDVGEGVEVFGGINSGKFYVAYDTFQTSVRSDGYAFGYWDDPRNDMSRVPIFGVAQDGHVIAPSITLTATQPASSVLAAPAAGGAPTWRQLGVADVSGAAPITSPSFLGTANFSAARMQTNPVTSNSQSSYSFQASDCGTTLLDNSAVAATWTVPSSLPVGCKITVIQETTAAVTFAGASGIATHAIGNATKTSGQYATAQLFIDTASSFILSGNVM
ncbi:hypothetical protein [Lichenicoccus sp.]|uniref:hypothetical protein n=1 Tax=Lichenicoccus sp. TaxID=2781899 RepID=UPI003D0B974C